MSFSHIYIGKYVNMVFKLQKNLRTPDNKFLLHTTGKIRPLKKEKNIFWEYLLLLFWEKLMSFCT